MRVFAILTGTPEGHIFAACFANSFEDNCADFRDLRVVDCFHCAIPGGIFCKSLGLKCIPFGRAQKLVNRNRLGYTVSGN